MNQIAQERRKRRLENGSVMFMNREFTFALDQVTKYPMSFQESYKMQSKSLVEEYMLMANILVAEQLFTFCKDKALLRAHNDITEEKKERLNDFFDKVGIKGVNLESAKTLSYSIENLRKTADEDVL